MGFGSVDVPSESAHVPLEMLTADRLALWPLLPVAVAANVYPPLQCFQCHSFVPALRIVDNSTYPEVHVQVSTSTELPVTDLEGDGHPVVGVQHFVETLARVSPQLHVVRKGKYNAGKQHQQRVEDGRHDCGVAADQWLGVMVVRSNATARSLGVEGGLCLVHRPLQ
jgi:hypothetical protein